MSMIRQIEIRGFKSIYDATLELGRVNCFIGANGVGKSNLLEAIGVLGAAANGVVDDESLLRRGVRAGLPRLYKSSFSSDRTPPHIMITATSANQATYRVALLNPMDSPEPAWSYKTEFLSNGETKIVADGDRKKKKLNPKAGLAALKLVDLEPDDPAARLMQRLQDFAIYCPNTPTLRGIVPDQQSRTPVGLSGGQLAEGFDNLRQHLEPESEEILEQLLGLIDWISDVETTSYGANLLSPKVPRTKRILKFNDRFMQKSRNELTAYDASEGALYVLFTAILCLLPSAPKIFAIDNLDQALNPRLLQALIAHLADWLSHNDRDRQLLFTAHNPAALDGLDLLDPEVRLFTIDRNSNGQTVINRLTLTEKLKKLNQQYPLSRLWLMGNLGAVPNV
jgi:hypothetical protein